MRPARLATGRTPSQGHPFGSAGQQVAARLRRLRRLGHHRRPAWPDLVSLILILCLLGYATTRLGDAEFAAGLLFVAVVSATVASCVTAAWRDRHRRTALVAWLLLAAAHLVISGTLVGQLLTGHPGAGRPGTWSDVVYLAYYPTVLVAAWLLVRDRTPRWRPSMWWDALVVVLGAGSAATTALWLMWPAGGSGVADSPVGLLAAVADAVLVTALLSVASLSGARLGPGPWWVSAGLCVVALADAAHLHTGTSSPGRDSVDLGWLVGYALVGLASRAAWVPRRPADRRHRPGPPVPARLPASLLPLGMTALAAGILGVAVLDGPVPGPSALLALGCLAAALLRSAAGQDVLPLRRSAGAGTDELTGLANRRTLAQVLAGDGTGHAPADAWSHGTDQVALLLVDIDRFKDINESLGHVAGDQVLAEVGRRLGSALRDGQLLARLGSDEFAVVLAGAGADPARRVAALLRGTLAEPLELPAGRVHVRASVGIATCQLPRGGTQDLLRQADLAVARAKSSGTGIEVFDPALDRVDTTRLRRTDELRAALERGDLEVYLQPQVDLVKGEVVGAEALARWRHPQDGVLLPASFLPLAAQTGLMRPVAVLLLDRALGACAQWWRRGHQVPVSVNLSADDLRDPQLPEVVEQALERHGLPPSALCVEITEEALLTDPAAAARLLHRWRETGVTVALDDFGTGYSALAYLRELPLDELKLDRVFVADLHSRTTATIVRHTVSMAHALRMRVVGEGVEDEATARRLVDAGCDIGQGLYFGDAMDPAAFLDHLEDAGD